MKIIVKVLKECPTWPPFGGHLDVVVLVQCFVVHAANEVVAGAGECQVECLRHIGQLKFKLKVIFKSNKVPVDSH